MAAARRANGAASRMIAIAAFMRFRIRDSCACHPAHSARPPASPAKGLDAAPRRTSASRNASVIALRGTTIGRTRPRDPRARRHWQSRAAARSARALPHSRPRRPMPSVTNHATLSSLPTSARRRAAADLLALRPRDPCRARSSSAGATTAGRARPGTIARSSAPVRPRSLRRTARTRTGRRPRCRGSTADADRPGRCGTADRRPAGCRCAAAGGSGCGRPGVDRSST